MKDKSSVPVVKIVNIIYMLLITNILGVICLIPGLVIFTFIPTLKTICSIMYLLLEDEIDPNSPILTIYFSEWKKNVKNNLKQSLVFGVTLLVFVLDFFALKILHNAMFTAINIAIVYFFLMFITFTYYSVLYKVIKEYKIIKLEEMPKNLDLYVGNIDRTKRVGLDIMAMMAFDIKKVIVSLLLIIVQFIAIGLMPALIVIGLFSTIIFILILINRSNIEKFLELKRKG